jgi:hypothetical protein
MQWKNTKPENCLTPTQQLFIKRAKLDVKIILHESSQASKYELFQRLNTGGSPLVDQEIRNAMLVAANREFFQWLNELSENPNFENCVTLSDRSYIEQFDKELVLRFLIFRSIGPEDVSKRLSGNDSLCFPVFERRAGFVNIRA